MIIQEASGEPAKGVAGFGNAMRELISSSVLASDAHAAQVTERLYYWECRLPSHDHWGCRCQAIHWLQQNFCLLQTDRQAKADSSIAESTEAVLSICLRVCRQRTVISVEEVTD